MKPDQNDFRRNSKTGKVCVVLQTLVLFCASLVVCELWAQTSTGTISSKNDPNALALITKALTALGGAGNWQSIGAATARVSISRPVGPEETVQSSYDWHQGYLLSRRDSSNANGRTATMLTRKDQHIRTVGGGKAQTIPRENDLAVLAKVNPGAALTLSLNQNTCVFTLVHAVNLNRIANEAGMGGVTVEEDCHDPFMPITARLTWTFSDSTGLPTQVRVPVRDMLHNAVAYETVTFTQFSRQGSVLVPSQVNITLPSGQIERLSIDHWSFMSSLPGSTFTTKP